MKRKRENYAQIETSSAKVPTAENAKCNCTNMNTYVRLNTEQLVSIDHWVFGMRSNRVRSLARSHRLISIAANLHR